MLLHQESLLQMAVVMKLATSPNKHPSTALTLGDDISYITLHILIPCMYFTSIDGYEIQVYIKQD